MDNASNYTKLEVWIKSRKLANFIYELTQSYPEHERYGISNQLRRCAISIASNIAEGIGRYSKKETIQFLYYSRGSLYELETQIVISFDQNYISLTEYQLVQKEITICKKLLNGLINFFKNS